VLIRHLWQLKAVVFLLIHVVLLTNQIKDVYTADGDVFAVLIPANKKLAAQPDFQVAGLSNGAMTFNLMTLNIMTLSVIVNIL
jgi:hypothetical protein